MLGAASRGMLLFWGGLYLVAAVVSVAFGVLESDLVFGLAFGAVFAVLGVGHWLALRWVDRHGTWQR